MKANEISSTKRSERMPAYLCTCFIRTGMFIRQTTTTAVKVVMRLRASRTATASSKKERGEQHSKNRFKLAHQPTDGSISDNEGTIERTKKQASKRAHSLRG